MERLELVGLLAVLLLAVVLVSLPFQVALYRHMENFWPDIFSATGQPKMLRLNGERFVGPAFYKFLFYRKHLALGDRRLSRLSDVNLVLVAAAALLFAALYFLIVLGKRL